MKKTPQQRPSFSLTRFHTNHIFFNLKRNCFSTANFSRWFFFSHLKHFCIAENVREHDALTTFLLDNKLLFVSNLLDLSLSLVPFFPPPLLKDCQFSVTLVGLVAAVQRTPSSPSTQTSLNKKEVRTEKKLFETNWFTMWCAEIPIRR